MSVVLLVEDDKLLRRTLRARVRGWGHDVLQATTGEEALSLASTTRVDLVLLDLGLPGIDGIETLRHLRSFTLVPVIVLTVRDSLQDKLAAFDAGADDFVTKPFEVEELLARSRAHLRRAASESHGAAVSAGDLTIDLARQLVTWRGDRVQLTPIELRVLEVLLEQRGKLVRRERLLEVVWSSAATSDLAKLRVTILHLRRKLRDDAARPRLIFTEPGLGYRWISPQEEDDDDGPDDDLFRFTSGR